MPTGSRGGLRGAPRVTKAQRGQRKHRRLGVPFRHDLENSFIRNGGGGGVGGRRLEEPVGAVDVGADADALLVVALALGDNTRSCTTAASHRENTRSCTTAASHRENTRSCTTAASHKSMPSGGEGRDLGGRGERLGAGREHRPAREHRVPQPHTPVAHLRP